MADRLQMNAALKQHVIPRLRELGFQGSFPDFRRDCGSHWDLLNFAFHRDGGALLLVMARCLPEGIESPLGHVDARQAKVVDRHPNYHRNVGHPAPVDGDAWFRFRQIVGLKTLCLAIRNQIEEPANWAGINPDGPETPFACANVTGATTPKPIPSPRT